MSGYEPVSWPVLEGHLRARPRWRRIGKEWHGPCPVREIGKNTCWFAQGDRAPVRGGCRKCGGRLSSADFREHLTAVLGDLPAATAASGKAPAVRAAAEVSPLPGRVWSASVALAPDSPGFRYLRSRGVVGATDRVPASVRWLPLHAAVAVRCAPRLPAACAGALVYRFAGPAEAETSAVQFEPVDAAGRRVECPLRGGVIKRPSVAGSSFAFGRRVSWPLAASTGGAAGWSRVPWMRWRFAGSTPSASSVAWIPPVGFVRSRSPARRSSAWRGFRAGSGRAPAGCPAGSCSLPTPTRRV